MQYDNTNRGVGWIKTSKSGQKYISIKMNIEGKDYNMSMFKNNHKQSDRQPDYNLLLSNKDFNKPAVIQKASQQDMGFVDDVNGKGLETPQRDPWQESKNNIKNDNDIPF